MNRLSIILALVFLAAAGTGASADELVNMAGNIRACFMDLQEVLENFSDYGKAKSELEEWAKPKKQLIEEKKAEIEKLDKGLKKASLLTEDARKERENEFKKELGNYQEMVGKIQQDLAEKEEELLAPIKEQLSKTIEEVSKSKGYNVVFDAAAPGGRPILFIDSGLDITKEVIEEVKARMEKKEKSSEKAGSPEKK